MSIFYVVLELVNTVVTIHQKHLFLELKELWTAKDIIHVTMKVSFRLKKILYLIPISFSYRSNFTFQI